MRLLDEAIQSAAKGLPRHFGPKSSGERQQLDHAFAATRATLQNDMDELRRLNTIAAVAIIVGLLFFGIAGALVLSGVLKLGAVSGVLGVVSEVCPLFLFNRIDRLRKDIADQLPFFRSAFSLMVIMEEAEANPETWKPTVDHIVQGLAKGATG